MIEIVGFGLAGACVALHLQRDGHRVRVIDDGLGGSTLVAAGLVNPVAGKNFEPSWEVQEAWSIALPFYQSLGADLFHSLPILRLWRNEKDRAKFESKRERLQPWIHSVSDEGVTWKHGGWLDTRLFLRRAKDAFQKNGGEWAAQAALPEQIRCTGAAGLLRNEFPEVEHRSAKGEILTVRIPDWNEKRILTRNGWIIPLDDDLYRVGATYEWDQLESGPSQAGRETVEALLKTFTNDPYEIVDHVAGIRPIIERSRPVVKYEKGCGWMVNGLGSKGVIYAPRVADQLVKELE